MSFVSRKFSVEAIFKCLTWHIVLFGNAIERDFGLLLSFLVFSDGVLQPGFLFRSVSGFWTRHGGGGD